MLEIKNFSKKYGDKEAVSHLSFVVNDGDIMGFVGKKRGRKDYYTKSVCGDYHDYRGRYSFGRHLGCQRANSL